MSVEHKLRVLSKIAGELNQHQITWAVGASLLLYFKGKTAVFHDLDLMVAEADAEKAGQILRSLGTLQPPDPHRQFQSKCFMEFVIESVEVDVIAGFTIVTADQRHYFPLRKEQIKDHTMVDGITVPLQSLAEWRHYYELMGRTEKVKMIDF